jgi:hypothetical protein
LKFRQTLKALVATQEFQKAGYLSFRSWKENSARFWPPQNSLVRVDFSLKREVFFVVIGAILGAITIVVPITFLYIGLGLPYYLTWMAFGHVIGVYSSSIIAGVATSDEYRHKGFKTGYKKIRNKC